MKLMTFDVASACGWAFWETERSESSMQNGCFQVEKCPKDMDDWLVRWTKRRSIYAAVAPMLRKFKPDAIILEQPLPNIKRYKKAGKPDLLGNGSDKPVEQGMNPASAFLAHQLFTVVDTFAFAHCGDKVFEVHPQTWQSILKPYRHAGDTKAQSIEACRVLRIPLPSQAWAKDNAADAAMIAVWAKGHLQQLKLLQRAKEAEAA
jgi:hypothetical protein